jgi:hypothetical protein
LCSNNQWHHEVHDANKHFSTFKLIYNEENIGMGKFQHQLTKEALTKAMRENSTPMKNHALMPDRAFSVKKT